MSKNTSSPSGCSALSSRYREDVSVLAAGTAQRKEHQLQSKQHFQLIGLKCEDLLGGLDLCWRWSVYEAGWRC